MHGRLNEPLFPQSETHIHMYLGDICMFMYLPICFCVIFGAYTIVKNIILYIYTHPPTFNQTIKNTYIPYHLVAAQWAALLKKIFSKNDLYIYIYIHIYIDTYIICFRLYTYTKVLRGSLNRWSHPMPTMCRQWSFVFFYRSCSLVASLTCGSKSRKTMLNRKDGMPHHDLWLKCFMIGCTFQ